MALWVLNSHFSYGLLVIAAFVAELVAHFFNRKQREILFFKACGASSMTQRILNIVLWILDAVVVGFLAYAFLRMLFIDHDHFTNANNKAITKLALFFVVQYGVLWLIILGNMITVTLFGGGSIYENRAFFGLFILNGILSILRVICLCIVGAMIWAHSLKLLAIFVLVAAALIFLQAVMYFFGSFFAFREVSSEKDAEDDGYTQMEDGIRRKKKSTYSKKHPKTGPSHSSHSSSKKPKKHRHDPDEESG